MKSQKEMILRYLQSGKTITGIEALNLFGCFRLAARINDLRLLGYEIISERKKGFRHSQYKMELK